MSNIEYILFGLFILIYLSTMGIAIKILMQRDKKIKLEKYKIDIEYGFNENLENKLDIIIDNAFNEYRFYNLEFRDYSYIKELEEQKIVKDVCKIVIDRISPVFFTQLSTYFNSDSIGNIIATKVHIKVSEYRVQKNIEGNS